MYKTILILEESTLVHDLFESALPRENWNWNVEHEHQPSRYFDRTKSVQPDIVFLSNNDHQEGYPTVNALQSNYTLKNIPIILLTSARDKIDEAKLQNIGVSGFLRKPFESSTLQDQLEAVFESQKQSRSKNRQEALDSINVIDDELLGILSNKDPKKISIDELENELDFSAQLLDEGGDSEVSLKNDFEDLSDEDTFAADNIKDLSENDTLSEDDLYELEEDDIEAEETELIELENLEPVEDEFDDEMEIEETTDDFDDLELPPETASQEVDITDLTDLTSETQQLEMEALDISETISLVIEEIDQGEHLLTNQKTAAGPVYNELSLENGLPESEEKLSELKAEKAVLEIEVEEVQNADSATDSSSNYIGKEGVTDIIVEFEEETELGDLVQENLEVEFDGFAESNNFDGETQDSGHINIDFDDDPNALNDFDEDTTSDEFEFESDDDLDIDNVENDVFELESENDVIEDIASEDQKDGGFDLDLLLDDDNQNNAASNIQQMINLRQVSKAKYDILEEDNDDSGPEDIDAIAEENGFSSEPDSTVDDAFENEDDNLYVETETMEPLGEETFDDETASEEIENDSIIFSETDDQLFSGELIAETESIDATQAMELELSSDDEDGSMFDDVNGEEVFSDETQGESGDKNEVLFEDPEESNDHLSDDLLMDVSLEFSDDEGLAETDFEEDNTVLPDMSLEDNNGDDLLLETEDGEESSSDRDEDKSDHLVELDAEVSLLDEIEVVAETTDQVGKEEPGLESSTEDNLFDDPMEEISLDEDPDLESLTEDVLESDLPLEEDPELDLLSDSDLADEPLEESSMEEIALDEDLDLELTTEDELMPDLSLEEDPDLELSLDSDLDDEATDEFSLEEDLDLEPTTEDEMMSDLSLEEDPGLDLSVDSDLDDEATDEISLEEDLDLEPTTEDELMSDLSLEEDPELELSVDSDLDDEATDEFSLEEDLDLEPTTEDELMSDLSLEEDPELELSLDSDLDDEATDEFSLEEDLDLEPTTEDELMSDLSLEEDPELELSIDSDLDDETTDDISLEDSLGLDASDEDDLMSDLSLEEEPEIELEDLKAEAIELSPLELDEPSHLDEPEVLDDEENDDNEAITLSDQGFEKPGEDFQQDLEGDSLESEEIFDFEGEDTDESENQADIEELEPIEEPDQPESIDTEEQMMATDQLQEQMDNIDSSDDMTITISSDVFEIGDLKLRSVAAEDEMDLQSPFDSQQENPVEAETEESASTDQLLENKMISESNRKALKSLSKENREELGSMLENVISDTLQSAINKVLPEMMEKIIQEELKD